MNDGDVFAYDRFHRLQQATLGATTNGSGQVTSFVHDLTYQLDAAGNRTEVVSDAIELSTTGEVRGQVRLENGSDPGGVTVTVDDARFVLEVVKDARRRGAEAVHHAEVVELLHGDDGQVSGARVRVRLSVRKPRAPTVWDDEY